MTDQIADEEDEPAVSRRDRILAGAWVGLIVFGLLLYLVRDAGALEPSTEVTGCVIRFTPSGPAIHVNSTHACTGATSVSVDDDGALRIDQADGPGRIASVTVAVDETLAGRGISCGASGGVGITIVRCFDAATGEYVRADSPRLVGSRSNLWLTWVRIPTGAAI